jgi:hypothetical protein
VLTEVPKERRGDGATSRQPPLREVLWGRGGGLIMPPAKGEGLRHESGTQPPPGWQRKRTAGTPLSARFCGGRVTVPELIQNEV